MSSDLVIGIDLGTSNSCVAVVEAGSPIVIPNRGYLTTPSVVAITADGRMLVGHAAKNQAITNAENTVTALKRLIGRRWGAHEIEGGPARAKLVEGPNGDVRIELHGKTYALAELSAAILLELKQAAEDHIGHPVEKAVITVPAYFNDGQRQATRQAGEIAGLDVIRMINEPTAAAVAYGFGKSKDRKVVVYDLGGGTFDISIVHMKGDGVFEVLGTGGDTFLGGEDFDRRIEAWIAERFRAGSGVALGDDRMTQQRVRDAAEEAKRALSERESVAIDIPFLAKGPGDGPIHFRDRLTRAQFEELTKSLVTRTIELTERAAAEAKVSFDQIDDLLLVGGSSRIPAVHRAVTQLVGQKVSQGVHPDEAVAIGAAIHGNSLSGAGGATITLRDVMQYTLGIRLKNNRREAILPKNTRVPASVTRNFRTIVDNQPSVDVAVLQGEDPAADRNTLLAQFRLDQLPPGPAGAVSIDVTLSVDESGVVHVTATDVVSRRAQSLKVLGSTELAPKAITEMRDSVKKSYGGVPVAEVFVGGPARPPFPRADAVAQPKAAVAQTESPPVAAAPAPVAAPRPPVSNDATLVLPPLSDFAKDLALGFETHVKKPAPSAKAQLPAKPASPVEDQIEALDRLVRASSQRLWSSEEGRSVLVECRAAIAGARESARDGDETAKRDRASQLARLEQALTALL